MNDTEYLKLLNKAINITWKIIKSHHTSIDNSQNHWDIFFRACDDAVKHFPPEIRDLMLDWLIAYSKFRDLQLQQLSNPDDYIVPDYLKLGVHKFLLDTSSKVK